MESSDDEILGGCEGRRTSRQRRNSIPELVGEAKKKLMLGVGKRRSEDRGANNNNHHNNNSTISARDRRSAMITFQMKTCELPELEESGEDSASSCSPKDRRHSYDQQLLANNNTMDVTAQSLSSIVADQGVSPLELKIIDHSPEVHTWWSRIAQD